MEIIQEYVVPITMVFCFMIGFAIKKFPKIDNKFIPLILMIIGGMASGLASTGVDQLVKQLANRKQG